MRRFDFAKVVIVAAAAVLAFGCASGPKVKVIELENKGTSMNVSTPDWIKNYTANGITAVQSQSPFKDKYCIIGEESGVNKQFVLAWADNFSAQQRIGAMLRTTIASEYQARVQGAAQSVGGANSTGAEGSGSGEYNQQIDNVINAIVNVSYSGAQREADWWSLRRRYDPDQKGVFSDEYTAYVLYIIPKSELNRQVAAALETAVSKDSALYDITIALARDILLGGVDISGGEAAAAQPVPVQASSSASASASASAGKVYKTGDTGPAGGLIFYDKGNDSGGWRYLEAAPVDIGPFVMASESVESPRERAVGTGKANTQAIMGRAYNLGGGFGWAAREADILTLNGFDDWFLPSRDELNYMYGNLHLRGLGNFQSVKYWSSTGETNTYYWGEDFANGNQSTGSRDEQRLIRPCRQF